MTWLRMPVLPICGVLVGCFPTFEDRPWLVEELRIIATRTEPAETRPGQQIGLEALVVSPAGTNDVAVGWSLCLRPRTSSERTGVTQACLAGDQLEPTENPATVPNNACALFGSNPPPSQGNEPPLRPADPDPSGGYFVPVHAQASAADDATAALGFHRIRCDLPAVTRDIFDAFLDQYTMNENPSVEQVQLRGANQTDEANEATVERNQLVTLRLIPTSDSSEPYVAYSARDSTLHERQEDLTVTWFVTAGELSTSTETKKRAQLRERRRFDNRWRAPARVGPVYGWAVLQDDRGGTDWTSFSIDVE